MTLTVGSLFSGIGGLDLGLERAGMKVIWQSEIDPYACKVLSKHWPEVVNHGNIKNIDWGRVERPDIICGGYPCQPFSLAGRRKGEQDSRHLWPFVWTAISELRPRYAILENVPGHISLGLDTVLANLAEIGYDAEWQIVSAASQGAPHLRERVWIVAYPNGSQQTDGRQCKDISSQNSGWRDDRAGSRTDFGEISLGSTRKGSKDVAHPNDTGNGTPRGGINSDWQTVKQRRQIFTLIGASRFGQDVAHPNCQFMGKRGLAVASRQANYRWDDYIRTEEANGLRQWWEIEPDVGRVADGVPSRVDRLRALGNAVVPQVAQFVGNLVVAHAEAEKAL